MSEEHERIRLLAEEVITSLPTRAVVNVVGETFTFFPRVLFAQDILVRATQHRFDVEHHRSRLTENYRNFEGAHPSARHEENIRKLADFIISQANILAQIVQSIFQREQNNIDPPDAIRVRSHVDSLSDLTGEQSDPRPLDADPFQIAAAARIPLVHSSQNPSELHGNDRDSMSDIFSVVPKPHPL
jgi:hypothetical protein